MGGARNRTARGWRILAPVRVMRARPQLLFSIAFGGVVAYLLPRLLPQISAAPRALVGWNAGTLSYFTLAIALHVGATADSIRARARALDEGRLAMLFLITAASIAAFAAVIMQLGGVKSMQGAEKAAAIGLTIVTVFDSWALLHLAYAFHYAHEYYTEEAKEPDQPPKTRGGLDFPNTETPQYLDFVYFSYVIGVACQTADVVICSTTMRSVAFTHGVVAFLFNTTIIALMVNIGSQFV